VWVITFTPTGSPLVILADPLTDRSVAINVSGFHREGATNVQIDEFLRGSEIIPRDRLNMRSFIRFNISRNFADYAGSLDFVMTHPEKLMCAKDPYYGSLIVRFGNAKSWTVSKAVAKFLDPQITGINVRGRYEIVGGLVT